MLARLLLLHFLLLLHQIPTNADAPACGSERDALLAFKNSLSAKNQLSSWRIQTRNLSSWRGVTLGDRGQVLQLQLPSLNLHGALFPLWGYLPWLRTMNLSGNTLTGTLDFSFQCGFSSLLVLDLSSNQLSGRIPEDVRRLQSLRELHLQHNKLSGQLPSGLFELGALRLVDFSRNNFTGTITSFIHLRSLQQLNISGNNFSGTLPDLSSFHELESLDASSNRLSGSIPGLGSLRVVNLSRNRFTGLPPGGTTSVQVLDLESNALSGNLGSLLTMTSLEHLNLAGNGFSGAIPPELGSSLLGLRILDLCSNSFTGGVPESFSSLRNLEQLKLSNNRLSEMPELGLCLPENLSVFSAGNNSFAGPLLLSTFTSSQLEVLYLSDNLFSGQLPAGLGQLKRLKKLILNRNRFRGGIPSSISGSELLEEIWINNNGLTGPIPVEVFNLRHLRMLVLANNNLSGSPVPPGVPGCNTLEVLWLEQNHFTGEIPPEIGELPGLLMLSLASNELTGGVPGSLGKLKTLVGLDLGSNSLSGGIPEELSGLSSIQFLFLSGNKMGEKIPEWIGSLPKLRALDFSFNSFSGSIPSRWKNSTLTSLSPKYSDKPPSAMVYNNEGKQYIGYALPTTLDFSNNELVGVIPPQLGALRNLQILNLSRNKLHGSIPGSLGDVPALMKLDLSGNNLTGRIPVELAKLTFLSELNLSDNNLSGEIPTSGQFPTFTNLSYMKNPNLCGPSLSHKCHQQRDGARSETSRLSVFQKLIPLYIVVAGSVGFCSFWVVFLVFIRRRQKLSQGEEEADEETAPKKFLNSSEASIISDGEAWISPSELLVATDHYSQANIIGDGGFGIVYKAILGDGSAVAVKKLVTDGAFGTQGEREFLAEMETLGKITHRNLVCLRGYSWDGRDRILVYRYLKNGSLDTWLHCRDEGVKPLDWRTRFGILLGAARGIEFLHHDCYPPIVHRDIKASNILLDENFEAHVADFGLARLMRDAGDTHVSTEVAGTVGYIPPEYNSSWMATMRGDVYSFGVVILETIIGKRPTDAGLRRAGGIGHLASESLSVSELESVVDPALISECCSETTGSGSSEVVEVMRIACLCCVEKPGRRPEMRHVVRMLEGVERRHSSAAGTNLVSPPSAEGGSKHFLNNVEI